MKRFIFFTACLLISMLPTIAMSADNIRFSKIAEVEIQQVNDKGETVLVREAAVLLQPGDIAIYTNLFTNTGQDVAEDVVIKNPIPENTEYLGGSATETGYNVTFSVDHGANFSTLQELTIPNGKGGMRPAEPLEYTDIRWAMQTSLKPGATGIVEFRVRVK